MSQAGSSISHRGMEQQHLLPFWYDTVKRVLDIALSVVGLVALFPLWFLIGVMIKLASPGPILYATETVGKDGKPFRLYKFRTMLASGDENSHQEYLARFVKADEPYTVVRQKDGSEQKIYKIVNDPRVTRIGRILRSTGLDEFPQLINVLREEMSLVGPRPPRLAEYENYQEWHKQRLTVMPGITGLYQITARSMVPFDRMVEIDLEYIQRRSLWIDLKIMFLTPIRLIILRKGGY